MSSGVSKIGFHHYLLSIIWPPLGFFFTGKPGTGIWVSLVLIIAVPLTLGIALLAWFGMVPHVFRRLRAWERGIDLIE